MEHTQPVILHRRAQAIALALAAVTLVVIPAGALLAQGKPRPYTVVETGRSYSRLQDAVDAIGSRQGTISIAPGIYMDCAVQQSGDISYFASEPGAVVFDGLICEDKGALVLRGRNANVYGITFRNMHSKYSGNAAGIRQEMGNLTVTQSWFKDSQQGILAGDDPASRILIDKSTFTNLGTCAYSGGCAHSIYIGSYGLLRVTRTRFEKGAGGHYAKSRAIRTEIASSSFDDSQGSWSNYMIDLPNGSTGQITNNWFVQGPDHENHSALIAVAAEKRANPSAGLRIEGNVAELAPTVNWTTTFVADWSGEPLAIGQNTLGKGIQKFERR